MGTPFLTSFSHHKCFHHHHNFTHWVAIFTIATNLTWYCAHHGGIHIWLSEKEIKLLVQQYCFSCLSSSIPAAVGWLVCMSDILILIYLYIVWYITLFNIYVELPTKVLVRVFFRALNKWLYCDMPHRQMAPQSLSLGKINNDEVYRRNG